MIAKTYQQIYIDGAWIDAGSDQYINVVNPATEHTIAHVQQASEPQVEQAVVAAHRAFSSWSQTPSSERGAYIKAIAERMNARQDLLAATVTAEMGMPLALSVPIQVQGPAEGMASYHQRAQLMDITRQAGSSTVVREPVGVCALITPWNYPLHQIVGKCAPALAAGCTMVLKPSEITPIDAIVFAEIIHEVGLPPGVFNLVQGTGTPVGESLVKHPLVDMVSFTGSTRAGTRISELVARDVKRVCLELGGKSPYIITEDADLEKAVEYGVTDVMINSGQTCTALTRMLLPKSRYEEGVELAKQMTEKLKVGDPLANDTFVGPMSSTRQRQTVLSYIEQGISEGVRLVTGGCERPAGLSTGAYVQPTVFADVNNAMRIAQEEIFGPVLCIMAYRNIDEAVAIANDTDYGLSSAVWAADKQAAEQIGRRLRAGLVHINGGEFNYETPFGGYKHSGNGREWGDEGLNEFIEIKSFNY